MVRRFAVDFLRNSLLLLCLFAPSAWMIATIPPLWRDADAYVQVTQKPLVATFWGHAPAYCYVAKVPLFLGEQIERLRGNTAAGPPERPQPALTDAGIWLLIVGQHLGMNVAIFCFITAVTSLFLVRLALALTWASNALFYIFAHCVGSETLGLILIVVLTLKALRLIQKGEAAGWTDWYLFAVVLVLCILSRDLNLALVAFGLWCWAWPVRRQWSVAAPLAWLWVAIELVNGVGHPLWSLREFRYTPGVATAPMLLVLAIYLARQLRMGHTPSAAA